MDVARSKVKELAGYGEYELVLTIAQHLNVTQEHVRQMPHDEAMMALSYTHHTNRAMGIYRQLTEPKKGQR